MEGWIRVRFYFGGNWVDDGGLQYVGGEYFEPPFGYEVDRFCFWNVRNFYRDELGMEEHAIRIWYKRSNVVGDAAFVAIRSDREIVDMTITEANMDFAEIFAIELGDEIPSAAVYKARLEARLKKGSEVGQQSLLGGVVEEDWNSDKEDEDDGGNGSSSSSEENDNEPLNGANLENEENMDDGNSLPMEDEDDEDDEDYIASSEEEELVDEAEYEDLIDYDVDERVVEDDHDPVIECDTELTGVLNDSDTEGATDYPWYNESLGNLSLGMKFTSNVIFRKALRDWSVKKGAGFVYTKNNKERVSAICKVSCGFRIYASLINDEGVFQIKTWHPQHKCTKKWKNKIVTARYLADKFLEEFRDNPDWKVIPMQRRMQKKVKAEISIKQCYRARARALAIIHGDTKKQYARLRDYGSMILNTSPGSRVIISTKDASPGWTKEQNPVALQPALVPLPPVPTFRYMYVRFAAQRKAFFAGLRPFIGLDGCFLKGVMGGQLLSAVAKDGNDNIYPLALAVVDAEDKSSWRWFLENILDDFGHPSETRMVFMSDKQKGLQEAMNELMPGVEHRICVKHLYENFKVTFKGRQFKELMWNASLTGSMTKWTYFLDEMKKLPMGEDAVRFLMRNDPRCWARSHFSTHCKMDLVVNNISESFNSAIGNARDKPILSMLEWIRNRMMKKICEKHTSMAAYEGRYCPNTVKLLERNKLGAGNCFPTQAGENKFEVECGGTSTVVDIRARTCTCRMWELTGIPCKHAIAAIHDCRQESEDFVDGCYTKAVYMEVYKHYFDPMPSQDEWPVTEAQRVHPPLIRKPTGRPKKKRKRQPEERVSFGCDLRMLANLSI